MAKTGITVDTKGFAKQVDRLAREIGLTAKIVMRDQMRLWLNDLMKRFPPTGAKGLTATGKGSISASKQGKDRVAKDVRKVIVGVDDADMKEMRQGERIFLVHKTKGVEFGGTGAIYGVDRDLYDRSASMSRIRAHHERFRRKSDGRVTEARAGSEKGRNTLNIGRWKFVDKLHVKKSAQRRYIRERQKQVGKLKAGWLPAAQVFGARPPAFVRKQATRLGSSSGLGTMNDSGDGFFEAQNNVPYAGRFGRIMRFSAKVRQRDLDAQLRKKFTRKINLENQRAA